MKSNLLYFVGMAILIYKCFEVVSKSESVALATATAGWGAFLGAGLTIGAFYLFHFRKNPKKQNEIL